LCLLSLSLLSEPALATSLHDYILVPSMFKEGTVECLALCLVQRKRVIIQYLTAVKER